jgi:dihydroorotate dehydrogenase
VPDPIELAGLRFPNRVGLAAGLDKNARCIDGLGAMGFGFVEVGTVTPRPQPGNPKPRMFRLPQANALINRLGFNNEGLDAFVANVQRPASGARAGCSGSTSARTPDADRGSHRRLPGLPGGRLSARRLRHGQHLQPQHQEPAGAARRRGARCPALRRRRETRATGRAHGRRVPLFVKIAPDLDEAQVQVIAAALQPARHGRRDRHQHHHRARQGEGPLAHAERAGGLSGGPVLDASNRVIAQLRATLGAALSIIVWAAC